MQLAQIKKRFAPLPWYESSPNWRQLDEELPADHRVRWLDNFINSLDCTVLEELYRGVGTDAYHPLAMLELGLPACLEGRASPAQFGGRYWQTLPLCRRRWGR